MYLNVRESRDYLLLGREIGTLLELEVAYRSRQGKVAVDTAKIDKAACSLNTCLLCCELLVAFGGYEEAPLTFILRLMVE